MLDHRLIAGIVVRVCFLAVVVTAVSASAASAAPIVYSQPLNFGAAQGGAFSHIQQQLAGEFALGSDASLEAASWYGTMHSADPLNTGDTWNFDVRFFADAANLPGAQLLSVGVVANVIDTGINIQQQRVYQFSATFAPIALDDGVSYWFSVINTGTQSTFRWTQSVGGLDTAFKRTATGPWVPLTETTDIPLNFTLYGTDVSTPVPEPATLSLLGLGLAGAAVRRFRKRK